MRRTLLVPLDGRPLAETALPPAVMLARTLGAELDLLRVASADEPVIADAHALAYLEQIAAEVDSLPVSIHLMRGTAGECIARHAATQDVGMVVMATHARSGVRRAVLGSIAEYVIAHAPSPTMLVRAGMHREPRLDTLLVAIGATCGAPLPMVTELARAAGARIVLLRVVAPEETCMWQSQRGPILDEPEVVVTARMHLNDLACRLRDAGVVAEGRVAIGAPERIINSLAAAIDADLIVMTTHAWRGAQRIVLGSVTDAVVRTADRPVLVCRMIPPPAGQVRQIDLFHALQHRPGRFVLPSIPEPLDRVQHASGSPHWGHLAGTR
jgi:nucleotide-binding universal stress UspA family protein